MATTARVVLTAEDKVTAVLKTVNGEVSRFGGVVSKLGGLTGALGGAALLAFAGNAIKAAAGLDDLAEQTGASVEELSKLEQVAILSDTAMADIAATSVKLTKALGDAQDPASNAAKALAAIGLSAKDLRGLDPAEQMQRIAQALGGFQDGAGKTALAVALLGKSGAQALPFLKDLAEAGKLNATLTAEQAAAAEQYEKSTKRLNLELNRMGKIIAVESIPYLTALREAGVEFAKTLLGIANEAGELADKDTIRRFAEQGARALAFLVDAGDGVVRVFQIAGTTVAGAIAAVVEAGQGNFAAARQILGDIRNEVGRILDRETFSARFERTLQRVKEEAKKAGPEIKNALTFSAGDGKKASEEIDDSRKALAALVEELQREADKLEEITTKERILRFLRANPSVDTAQVREKLALQEKILDTRLRDAAAKKEDAKSDAESLALLKQLDDELISFTQRANDARKMALTARLEARLAAGEVFTKEELDNIVRGIGQIGQEVDKTGESIQELGLIFTSALGEFIKDPKGSNFFTALAQDVLQFTTKLLILEPILKMIKQSVASNTSGGSTDIMGFLGSLGSSIMGSFGGARAAGGPVYAGQGYLVGERGPEFFRPRQAGTIIPNGGGAPSFTFNVTGSIDARSAQQIAAATARKLNLANRRLN